MVTYYYRCFMHFVDWIFFVMMTSIFSCRVRLSISWDKNTRQGRSNWKKKEISYEVLRMYCTTCIRIRKVKKRIWAQLSGFLMDGQIFNLDAIIQCKNSMILQFLFFNLAHDIFSIEEAKTFNRSLYWAEGQHRTKLHSLFWDEILICEKRGLTTNYHYNDKITMIKHSL